MGQSEDLQSATVDYVRLELVAVVLSSMARLFILVMVMRTWNKALYAVLLVQVKGKST